MAEKPSDPRLDHILEPTEEVHPDHREHAKAPRPVDDAELERRVERERNEMGAGGPLDA